VHATLKISDCATFLNKQQKKTIQKQFYFCFENTFDSQIFLNENIFVSKEFNFHFGNTFTFVCKLKSFLFKNKNNFTFVEKTLSFRKCFVKKNIFVSKKIYFRFGNTSQKKSKKIRISSEMITIRFAGCMSGRIVSLQLDTDIQKILSNGNRIRIRISERLFSIFREFILLEKVAHCTVIHLLSLEASFQPSVPWLWVCLWCNLSTVVYSYAPS